MLTSDDLAFFCVVSGSASLADAARKLNVTPPAITQRLKALEQRVGVRLMDRTPRGLALTDEGEMLVAEGAAIIEAIEGLAESLGRRTTRVRGKLRIAAPYGFGREHVAPVVAEFARLHPEATVILELSDHPNVLTSDSWDVVIHIGALNAAGRLVTTLAPNGRVACAAPAYLDGRAPIAHPDDLRHHRCLALRENNEDVTLWRFSHPEQGAAAVRVRPAMSTNDGTIMRGWALAGLGVIVRSEWDVAGDLAAGRLVRVLPDWTCPAADVVALLNARHGRSRRATVFLEMMRDALHPVPWPVPWPVP
ncbi:LysR family transcriptional regulator [Azospirillum sp. 412522]|nr:LysR family transcriptional regulator [Azospirillum sp. 412522]MBY6263663.1 LysR family transcriptional regulator [Azospirillum sp. 412522]